MVAVVAIILLVLVVVLLLLLLLLLNIVASLHIQIVDLAREIVCDAKTKASPSYMLWCRSGKHRSVAGSLIVEDVLKRMGFEVFRLAFAINKSVLPKSKLIHVPVLLRFFDKARLRASHFFVPKLNLKSRFCAYPLSQLLFLKGGGGPHLQLLVGLDQVPARSSPARWPQCLLQPVRLWPDTCQRCGVPEGLR